MDDSPQLFDTDLSDNGSDEQPIESLVAGRERRKTAGNRYDRGTVLEEAVEAEDQDEVTLLFADDEEEEDEEFKSDAEDEDAEMSSSDDDDQGPNAAPDDLEGEKELETQAKQARARKRKADLALTSVAGVRKKLKTDPTRPATSAPAKQSKKKERVTWVHDQDSGRSSLRKQTIAHRAETIARLKESEAQSKKLKAQKEKREREKARDAPKELTQADRLAEAARVERQNAKSLNRWEAMEKKRQEEQATKLAALKNRKLEGAVVTWLSQKVKCYGPEPGKIGTKDAAEFTGPKKRGRKSRAELEQMAAETAAESTATPAGPMTTGSGTPVLPSTSDQSTQAVPVVAQPPPAPVVHANEKPQAPASSADKTPQATTTVHTAEDPDSFLKGIHEYANEQADSNLSESKPVTPTAQDTDAQQDTEMRESAAPEMEISPATVAENDNILANPPAPAVPSTLNQSSADSMEIVTIKAEAPALQAPVFTAPEPERLMPIPMIVGLESAPEPPQIEEDSTRNLLILEKFNDLSGSARQDYAFFYNKKTARTAAKIGRASQELCPITASTVRYRDPATGIAYANALAYKKLQELKDHKYTWSSMLGCYVGLEGGVAARGVPEGWG